MFAGRQVSELLPLLLAIYLVEGMRLLIAYAGIRILSKSIEYLEAWMFLRYESKSLSTNV